MSAMLGDAPFQIGQVIYIPWANAYGETHVTCPICSGNRSVVLILGSGEHVAVECQGCGLGCDGPQGVVLKRGPLSGIEETAVSGLQRTSDGWRVLTGPHDSHSAEEVFAEKTFAESRRSVLHAEAEVQAERNFETRFKTSRKDHGWTVRYHRGQIANLERSLAWHRNKLTTAKP